MKKLFLIFIASLIAVSAFSQQKYYNAQEFRHSPTDTTSALQKNGNVIYQASANKLYVRLSGVWRPFTTTAGGGTLSFGLVNQTPVVNSTATDFSYSANYSYDITNNNFRAARSFTNTNTGTQNNNAVIGESSQWLGTSGNIRWTTLITEQGILASNGASGVIHNAGIYSGFNNKIEKNNTFNSFSCGIYNSNNCYIGALTASTVSSMILASRNDTILNASSALALGYRAKVTGDGALGHGFFDTYSLGSHTGTIPSCEIAGKGAFGFFTNTSAGAIGRGVHGPYGVALGGLNPYIPATSSHCGILGGNGITARASEDYQWYLPNLNIVVQPLQNDTLSQVMVRDWTTGQIKYRAASTLGGSGISGLTTNRFTFATSSTTIGDDAAFVADGTNNAIVIDGARIHATGTDNLFTGDNAGNFTTTGTQSTGIGEEALNALTTGALNTSIGANSLKLLQDGNANTAVGYNALASNVSGLSNTALGSSALQSVTGSNNIAIGATAGDNITSGGNNIIIGRQRDAQSATTSNQLDIQGIIFGTGNSATGTSVSTGNIGIGVAAPSARLHLPAGTTAAGTASLKIPSGALLTTPEDGAVVYDGTNLNFDGGSTHYILPKTLYASATLDFASTAAGSESDLTITVTGAADGDIVSIGVPNASITATGCYTAWVSAANTVTIRFSNYDTITARDPASGTFKVSVSKY
jgi:hypothetical protein